MAETLLPHALTRPDEPALIDERGVTTWRAFNDRVNRIIDGFRAAGLHSGDTFSLMAGNSRAWFEVYLAAAHSGLTFVPVNWHWTADELRYVLDNSDSVALVCDARFADTALAALEGSPALRLLLALPHSGHEDEAITDSIDGFIDYETFLAAGSPEEPADQTVGGPMFYTSGTTGRPKGVRSGYTGSGASPSLLTLMAAGFSAMLGAPSGGITFLDGPIYHSAQWAFSFFPLMGGSSIVMRHKFDAAETLRVIDEHHVTNVHLVPTQFIRLLKLPDEVRDRFDGSSLHVIWHGAAPCPPEIKRRMIAWWGPKITEYYGGTEGAIATIISSQDWLERPGSVGRALDMMEVTIVDDEGNEVGPNIPGTIFMRNKMGTDFEYHKDAEKTAKAHRAPGQLTLGDVGYLDADGYLFMSDRKIDMIISGGVNIYPAEIEGVLAEHPAVRDAAVFGIPDDEFGEQVKAAVELTEGVSPSPELAAELIEHVRVRLAGYKAPRSIDFETALPRTPTGKLLKRTLRDQYWKDTGRSI